MRVVARCPLEPRRSVFVIETAGPLLPGRRRRRADGAARGAGRRQAAQGARGRRGAALRRRAGARCSGGEPAGTRRARRPAGEADMSAVRCCSLAVVAAARCPASRTRPPRTRTPRTTRGPGVAPAGADPGDGGAVADPVRAADGHVVRAHLGGAVDPAQRDRHALGAAHAGADRAGAGADDRGDGAHRPADVRRDGARAGDGRRRRRRQRRDAWRRWAPPPTAARSRCASSSSSTPTRATARRSSR